MSEKAQREMTLEEWVDTLPTDHQARKELTQLKEELEHAIKQYEHWEKEIAEQDKELNQIEALLIRLRNFVVKAEGHWLYGERWTDWIDKHLPKEKLIE